jgi:hypothetical protein
MGVLINENKTEITNVQELGSRVDFNSVDPLCVSEVPENKPATIQTQSNSIQNKILSIHNVSPAPKKKSLSIQNESSASHNQSTILQNWSNINLDETPLKVPPPSYADLRKQLDDDIPPKRSHSNCPTTKGRRERWLGLLNGKKTLEDL